MYDKQVSTAAKMKSRTKNKFLVFFCCHRRSYRCRCCCRCIRILLRRFQFFFSHYCYCCSHLNMKPNPKKRNQQQQLALLHTTIKLSELMDSARINTHISGYHLSFLSFSSFFCFNFNATVCMRIPLTP